MNIYYHFEGINVINEKVYALGISLIFDGSYSRNFLNSTYSIIWYQNQILSNKYNTCNFVDPLMVHHQTETYIKLSN